MPFGLRRDRELSVFVLGSGFSEDTYSHPHVPGWHVHSSPAAGRLGCRLIGGGVTAERAALGRGDQGLVLPSPAPHPPAGTVSLEPGRGAHCAGAWRRRGDLGHLGAA